MADKQFLRLSERWALAYDSLQWIIQRRGSVDKRSGKCRWNGESFISSCVTSAPVGQIEVFA